MDPFALNLATRYNLTPDQVTPTKTPGYWRIKKPCGGIKEGCRHLIHSTLGNEGSVHHTVSYRDPIRDKNGRWASPYRTWKAHRARLEGQGLISQATT